MFDAEASEKSWWQNIFVSHRQARNDLRSRGVIAPLTSAPHRHIQLVLVPKEINIHMEEIFLPILRLILT